MTTVRNRLWRMPAGDGRAWCVPWSVIHRDGRDSGWARRPLARDGGGEWARSVVVCGGGLGGT